ncbi:hypothetical protein CP8484711_0156 [Chlamydia psittaci 84-8471/1]|nr:hypothetical protein CP8484711_0156 [Chlamydia psittaci 84-8471/1]BEU43760.1 hypothetical protein NRM5_000730 [Chlamydia psittaci]
MPSESIERPKSDKVPEERKIEYPEQEDSPKPDKQENSKKSTIRIENILKLRRMLCYSI